jgi:hypothetical protein
MAGTEGVGEHKYPPKKMWGYNEKQNQKRHQSPKTNGD